ncbi:hypothetical protein N0V91_011238, partial [Didymella pomorum]
SGFPLDPTTLQPFNPADGQPVATPINPATLPIDSRNGFPNLNGTLVDPSSGRPLAIDPTSGFPINPTTLVPFNPANGQPLISIPPATTPVVDPATLPIDPISGFPTNNGTLINPSNGLPLAIDPTSGFPINPNTLVPFNPVTGEPLIPGTSPNGTTPAQPEVTPPTSLPIDTSGLPIDPASGFPVNNGTLYNPSTGLPLAIDPTSGFPINPDTLTPFNPVTGEPLLPSATPPTPIDTSTLPLDPISGFPANNGTLYNPATGLPLALDPTSGFPVNPTSGVPFNPLTGEPLLPGGSPNSTTPAQPGATPPVPIDTSVLPLDPISGFPISNGTLFDPATGLPLNIDPTSGFPIDPSTGVPFSPLTGLPLLPGTGPNNTTPAQPGITPPPTPDLTNDSIPDILKPSDLGLLATAPAVIAKAINDAAQHLSPNDPNVRGWQEFGCFTSNNLFNGALTPASAAPGAPQVAMSAQVCIGLCVTQGADYSYVIGGACYCSVTPPPAGSGSTKCTRQCDGDPSLFCGNPTDNGYSIFKRLVTPNSAVPLPLRPAPNSYQYDGCFFGNDFTSTATYVASGSAGIEACSAAAAARSLQYAALQGDTCYASNTAPSSSSEAGIGLCSIPCSGNSLEACGGTTLAANTAGLTQLITLYTAGPPPVTTIPSPIDTNSTVPTGPNGSYVGGCVRASTFILNAISGGRQFSYAQDPVVDNSGGKCYGQCRDAGFLYSLVNGASCYCSNIAPVTSAANQADCNLPCPNNPDQRCGGQGDPSSPDGGLLGNVFSTLAIDTPVIQVRPLISFVRRTHALCSVANRSMLCRALARDSALQR